MAISPSTSPFAATCRNRVVISACCAWSTVCRGCRAWTCDRARHAEATARFLQTANDGDVEGLISLLAPDVVLVSDGGGKKRAALRPMYGPEKVARWMIAIIERPDIADLQIRVVELNGEPAIVAYAGDAPDTVGFVEIGADGIVSAIYLMRNPDKLGAVPRLGQLPA